jgi:hypothetical protein
VGVIDPQKAPVVLEMFTRYTTGKYSDMQIASRRVVPKPGQKAARVHLL